MCKISRRTCFTECFNAIRKSTGKYILPLDGDDKITSTYLEKAVPILENDDNIKIVYGEVKFFGVCSGLKKLRPYSMATLLVDNCFTNSSLFRRRDYEKTGGYNPNMARGLEDWDFWISLLEDGGSVHKIEEVCLYYRILPTSRNKEVSNKMKELQNQIWRNHLDLYQREYLKLWNMHQVTEYSHFFFSNKTCYDNANSRFTRRTITLINRGGACSFLTKSFLKIMDLLFLHGHKYK
jgi:glycosyltransferase involved in cell wall biosynthesis